MFKKDMICVDKRLANTESWHLIPPKDINMRLPDIVKKCVTFIGVEVGGKYHFCGTGFFICVEGRGGLFVYLVTAKHVAIELAGKEFVVRVNRKGGSCLLVKATGDLTWQFNPDDALASDVAICHFSIPPEHQLALEPV